MKKQTIKLNESQLRNIIKESIKKVLRESYVEDNNLQFIDKYEIEEMLGEYYDFSHVTNSQWEDIDSLIYSECKKRGISPDDYENYAKVCDACVGRVLGS